MTNNTSLTPANDTHIPPTPRKALAIALLAGLGSGFLFTALLWNSMIGISFFYLAPLPVFLVGLSLGRSGSYIAAAVGTAALVFLSGDLPLAGFYILLIGFPCAFLMILAYRPQAAQQDTFAPPSDYIVGLLGCAAFFFAVFNLIAILHPPPAISRSGTAIVSTFSAPILEYIWRSLETVAKALTTIPGLGVEPEQMSKGLRAITPLVPAFLLANWFVQMVLNLWIAASTVRKQNWNRKTIPSVLDYALPRWTSILMVLAFLGTFVLGPKFNFVASDTTFMLCLPFLLLGLVLCHTYIDDVADRRDWSWGRRIAVYIAFYILISIPYFMGFAMVALILLGIAEQWLHLRRRFAIKAP